MFSRAVILFVICSDAIRVGLLHFGHISLIDEHTLAVCPYLQQREHYLYSGVKDEYVGR